MPVVCVVIDFEPETTPTSGMVYDEDASQRELPISYSNTHTHTRTHTLILTLAITTVMRQHYNTDACVYTVNHKNVTFYF